MMIPLMFVTCSYLLFLAGNGVQHVFEDDDDVLYISLHRYEDGYFYPASEDAAHTSVGRGKGRGRTVNIPWPCGGMGDADYMHAFRSVVLPIAQQFAPELIFSTPITFFLCTSKGRFGLLTRLVQSLRALTPPRATRSVAAR